MSNNMNKQLFNLFLTSLAKKPKLTDWEIRQAHLRNNLGVSGKRKGDVAQFKKTSQEGEGGAALTTFFRALS